MKRLLLILIITAATLGAVAQGSAPGTVYKRMTLEVVDGDTVLTVHLPPVYKFNRPIDERRYARLIHNVKVVYPIAKEAKNKLAEMETYLLTLPNEKQQRAYIKRMEDEIKEQYTPVLKKMTFSQGKILIKLIDRETDHTSYALVKEMRGGFSAAFWQGIARVFGANLKEGYNKEEGEDKMIEQIIILYEAGVI